MKKGIIAVLVLTLAVGIGFFTQGIEAGGHVYQDGTFMGYSDATDRGYVDAEVTIENDSIVDVVIRGYGNLGTEKPETYPWDEYHEALEVLPELYVERDHWDVDIISGATGTSNQANQAVYRALASARVEPTNQKNEFFDGTFMAISDKTERGWVIVWVTFANDKITDFRLVETQSDNDSWQRKGDDYPWDEYHELLEVLPEQIIEAQSLDVDGLSGATGTFNRAIQAAERAMDKARR